jgi:hypothetical protein
VSGSSNSFAGVDAGGFPPHSPQWLAYWDDYFVKGKHNETPGKRPLAALLAVMRSDQTLLSKMGPEDC